MVELRTVLAFVSSFFGLTTTVVNLLILIAIFGPRRAYYRSHFFYVIYMVGVLIDIVALANCHLLALLPSKGLFLDTFLSSTKLGRLFLFLAWSSRTCQGFTNFFIALNRVTAIVAPIWSQSSIRGLCFTVQFGVGIGVGLVAAVLNVYWCNTSADSWYIQFYDTPSTHLFFDYVFALITFFSMLTIAAYAVLIFNFQSDSRKSVRRSASDQNDREVKNEQSLVYIAICVCTMETMYYVMYCYGFIMNANFQLNLETIYVSYFLFTDLYSGVPPYLLLLFSTPIRQDVKRILSPLMNGVVRRIDNKVTPLSTDEDQV
ncbi:hypothetical protein PRIPAC_77522 [Pristionchus pacificus]|uniref:G protein-coupled receptor n=1 Tax=Pristionchus pacificus TaxID=54126 RepID=A0A2A6C3J4_PRIPA|nr:hypothetical protein PRIPAC_77522 [Pristionchus pacificus]|eukprot:PDM72700.1 G protein-coupled receptor [Pristionchus pacificus]